MRRNHFPSATTAILSIAMASSAFALAATLLSSPERVTSAAFLDSPDQPVALDVDTNGSLWLALRTDFFGGGARMLDADLNAIGGFAARAASIGIAVDADGDILLLESGRVDGSPSVGFIERYSASGSHQGRIGSSTDILNFDAAGGPRSAWALIQPTAIPDRTAEIPRAARFDDGSLAVPGLPTLADARRIASAPDGTFYVATDYDAPMQMVIHYSAEGTSIGSWPIEHPIAAIDVNAGDGSVWVASGPPPLPDLSKTRIQGFPADGGTPPGTDFADFEMDLDAIDIAAWSTSSDTQCSIYGVGVFGIGALWTIARHDCDGTLLATTRDIPQVGIWTPVPTATAGAGSPTVVPGDTPTGTTSPTDDTPDPTPSATSTSSDTTATATSTSSDPTATATFTAPGPTPSDVPPTPDSTSSPTPTSPPDPTWAASIYLPITLDFAFRIDLGAATADPAISPTSPSTSTATSNPTLVTSPPPTATPTISDGAEVAIQIAHGAGFSLEQLIGGLPSQAPWFILYRDGTVLRRTSAYGWRIARANAEAVADLRDGLITRPNFFELPNTNYACGIVDIGTTFVHVADDMRAHTVHGDGLELYADDGCVAVPPGTTFERWRSLAEGIGDARERVFGPVIGWVPTHGTLAVKRSAIGDTRPWPVPSIALSDVAPADDFGYGTLALDGSALVAVYAELGAGSDTVQSFFDGGVGYTVGLRVEPPGWDEYIEAP